jgi:quercetin dioxygenase-like cupin family protein
MPDNDYTFVPDLLREFAIPENGIISRVLYKDDRLNITLFGFSAGQELSTHSAPTPALIYVLEGDAEIDLGSDTVQVKPGSFIRMAPLLSHAVRANSPLRMLLVQVKENPRQK